MLAVAREFGVKYLVEDSSGNAGASVSAYAARCGIKAHIFAPDSAPRAKLNQIKVYGGETHLIPGPREASAEAALAFCEQHNLVYASHNLSPYFLEGTKTFAHELPTNFPDRLPDHIVMPVGNGSLFLGTWIGLREMQTCGTIDTIPQTPRSPGRRRQTHRRRLSRQDLDARPGQPHHSRWNLSSPTPAFTSGRRCPPQIRRRCNRSPRR